MKKSMILLSMLIVSIALAFAADPAEGLWKSIDEKTGKPTGVWNIYVENDKLYGTMLVCMDHNPKAAVTACKDSYPDFPKKGKVKNMALVGTPFIYNLVKKAEGSWHKGYIIDPTNGKRYQCKINFKKADGKKFKVDTLQMRGEIGLGIGRNQWWVKSSPEEVAELIKSNVVKHEFVEATE
ncbi:DUF2147 domain-containing protein [Treponema phagedenis]|uniref:DUF2147 domain-containing protein n=1 Tax=Treponema phagedenis TaxID=162 RepID=A0A0B7GRJ3_TREPH|nr:DUF2147 domain-containing protein [Treponema phagedenis]NVP24740.1 DUF2147 domain-containing protein [Treponema phagedenis]QEJ98855.1 DUF2147 domain-containing protein [Treponema phagedenis]QEK00454.1 DUF2147 domain-containing protein [Treponema phagedenis]QEK04361.1 DUF2147 domain-containing protein [Treponema phagedenis]QEK05464.1 DUF2147 domain-containing protein [Treponema phagedenis]